MAKLELIKNNIPYEQRIQNRIDAFIQDIMEGDGNIEHVEQIMCEVHDYLYQYEDEHLLIFSSGIPGEPIVISPHELSISILSRIILSQEYCTAIAPPP